VAHFEGIFVISLHIFITHFKLLGVYVTIYVHSIAAHWQANKLVQANKSFSMWIFGSYYLLNTFSIADLKIKAFKECYWLVK